MGLVIFAALGLYFLLSLGVVIGSVRYAKRYKKSAVRWGWGSVLVMYLIPFWDWIPTVAMHRYYCATEAGFWVYKTPEQWMVENPGVIDNLTANKDWPSKHEERHGGHEKIDIGLANDRFNIIVMQQDVMNLLPIIRRQEEVKDIQRNEILARFVDFSSGNSVAHTAGPPGPLKFWMRNESCAKGSEFAISSRKWMDKFRGAK